MYVVTLPSRSVTFHRRPLASYWNPTDRAGLAQSVTPVSFPLGVREGQASATGRIRHPGIARVGTAFIR